MKQSDPAFLLCSPGALHEAGIKDMYTSVFHYAGTDFLKKTCQIFQNFQKDLGEEGDKSTICTLIPCLGWLKSSSNLIHLKGEEGEILSLSSKLKK